MKDFDSAWGFNTYYVKTQLKGAVDTISGELSFNTYYVKTHSGESSIFRRRLRRNLPQGRRHHFLKEHLISIHPMFGSGLTQPVGKPPKFYFNTSSIHFRPESPAPFRVLSGFQHLLCSVSAGGGGRFDQAGYAVHPLSRSPCL